MNVCARRPRMVAAALLPLLALAALVPAGCAARQLRVVPQPNQDVLVLTADEIVAVMRQAGFADPEIERLGPDLRDALALQGAARIRSPEFTEAIFLSHGPLLYVSVRGRGGFWYDTKKDVAVSPLSTGPGPFPVPQPFGADRERRHDH